MSKLVKKIIKGTCAAALVTSCGFVIMGTLSGCQGNPLGITQTDINKAETKAYITQINSLSNHFTGALADFKTCVNNKDVKSMEEKLKDAQEVIDTFNKIGNVPSECTEIQQTYNDGFLQLQNTLDEYIHLYNDIKDNRISTDVAKARIKEIQHSYDMGVKFLNRGDELVAEKS